MEAVFASIILIHICGVEAYYRPSSYSSSSSSSSSTIIAIVLPIAVCLVTFVVVLIVCKIKCVNRQRMGVLPLSTQIALAQQENAYAPPSFRQPSPYDQPPPYGQPPPYPVANAPFEPTKTTLPS